MLTEEIKKQERFAIFGAQVVAYGAYCAIRELTGNRPDCFLVSSRDGNPEEIDGIPVLAASEAERERLVLICVSGLLQREARHSLEQLGYTKLFVLTNHEEYCLMRAYFDKIEKFPALGEGRNAPSDLAMYEVSNHRDKPLESHPELQSWEHAIQAGAALTEKRIAPLTDDAGDNISAKNRQYCEMSATYWVWKNTQSAWKGIEHYRRHLLVRPEQLGGDVDAVLPLPYLCYPDTAAQFRRFVSENVLDALLTALKTLHPAEYETYCDILYGPYQYTYNLVCAKEQVFDGYCAWFFRITEYMETRTDIAPELADTRALSYVAEALTNIYFMSHQNELAIRHAEKEIYT